MKRKEREAARKCTTNVQQPFIWGGSHNVWGPPHVKGCCIFVVGVMYNYHYSLEKHQLHVGYTPLSHGGVTYKGWDTTIETNLSISN
jgi:hypothetical protein